MCDTILYAINSTGAQSVKFLPIVNTDELNANDITVTNNVTTNSLTSNIISLPRPALVNATTTTLTFAQQSSKYQVIYTVGGNIPANDFTAFTFNIPNVAGNNTFAYANLSAGVFAQVALQSDNVLVFDGQIIVQVYNPTAVGVQITGLAISLIIFY